MDKIDFHGKVAIITGASSGIGAATAVAFASYGAKLTLVGRNEARLLETANKCVSKSSLVPLWLQLDLTHPGSCQRLINKTVEMYGRIDILVNCAGKVAVSSLFDESMDIFDDLMNINFRVPYQLSQLALPYLITTKGNIVNIGSSMTRRYKPGILPYIISKSAVEVFTKFAAPELITEGVRINSICPGHTKTNILQNVNITEDIKEVTYDVLAQDMPNGEVLEPEEVATLICLAASDVFPSMNGSELLVDGASCMA
ncbi:putative oxidoreductase SSP0419 [Anticarsia gemmatalis]|uniref:putative oxidoreductase SSP0419 n=1 Tax=Anticarsia gemmatalis TaxID=129554 RepID=UPI003F777F46